MAEEIGGHREQYHNILCILLCVLYGVNSLCARVIENNTLLIGNSAFEEFYLVAVYLLNTYVYRCACE